MRPFLQIIASFLTFTFHTATRMRCDEVFITITSLHVYCWVRQWKTFENRSTYGKVMGKSRVSYFLTRGVHRDRVHQQNLISWCYIVTRSKKFHQNSSAAVCVIPLTDRRTHKSENITSLAEMIIIANFSTMSYLTSLYTRCTKLTPVDTLRFWMRTIWTLLSSRSISGTESHLIYTL